MTLTVTHGYEFGEFVLFPEQRLLLHLNNPVQIREKELDILTHLITHATRNVTANELIAAVWNPEANLAAGNVSHHIARLRRVLGCDARKPKYIRTLPGNKGYRFVAPVVEKDFDRIPSHALPFDNRDQTEARVTTTIHLFSPVFLGERAYDQIGGTKVQSVWGNYKEFRLESARLWINRSGFGVWHIATNHSFSHLYEASAWRQQTYREILDGKHTINRITKGLIKSVDDYSVLNEYLGRVDYVFSVTILNNSNAKRKETLRNILRILASLRSLELRGRGIPDEQNLARIERQMIDDGFESGDLRQFGLPGSDVGFAGWGGLSYVDLVSSGGSLESTIIEFEIAVQSLWWLCKCLISLRVTEGERATAIVRNYLPDVRRQYSMIKSVGATDSPSRRTMVEAVLDTSRIKDMVDEVIEIAE